MTHWQARWCVFMASIGVPVQCDSLSLPMMHSAQAAVKLQQSSGGCAHKSSSNLEAAEAHATYSPILSTPSANPHTCTILSCWYN